MATTELSPQPPQPGRRYFQGAAAILLLTGLAKLFSSLGTAEIFEVLDPVFILKFRYVLVGVGLVELAVATVLLCGLHWELKALLTLWIGGSFAIYRVGLVMLDFDAPCPCVGSVAKSLGVSEKVTRLGTASAMLYLLVGSTVLLAVHRVRKKQTVSPVI